MIPVLPHAGTRATGADAEIHPDPGFVIPAIGVDSVPMRLGLTLDGKLWIRRTDSWPASSPVIVVPRQENLAAVFPWPGGRSSRGRTLPGSALSRMVRPGCRERPHCSYQECQQHRWQGPEMEAAGQDGERRERQRLTFTDSTSRSTKEESAMRLSTLVTMSVSSLALAAGGVFAVSAVTPASAATTTPGSPQAHTAVLTSDHWGGWCDRGDWGRWGCWDDRDWGGWC
jgi:hypothetical protein